MYPIITRPAFTHLMTLPLNDVHLLGIVTFGRGSKVNTLFPHSFMFVIMNNIQNIPPSVQSKEIHYFTDGYKQTNRRERKADFV